MPAGTARHTRPPHDKSQIHLASLYDLNHFLPNLWSEAADAVDAGRLHEYEVDRIDGDSRDAFAPDYGLEPNLVRGGVSAMAAQILGETTEAVQKAETDPPDSDTDPRISGVQSSTWAMACRSRLP